MSSEEQRPPQRGVDVHDPLPEAPDEGGAEDLHVAGEDDQVRFPPLDPVAHREVARPAVGELLAGEYRGLDRRLARPSQRPRLSRPRSRSVSDSGSECERAMRSPPQL